MMPRSKIRDLSRDFFQRGQRNPHEAFSGRSVQVCPFRFSQIIALHICVTVRRNDGGRASSAFAEVWQPTVFTDNFVDFHSFLG